MRHLKAGRALGVSRSHRRAMMRNLVTSVLEHQQIKTTVARAKELRKPLDKMITLGKRGDLNARRQALRFVKSKAAMANLFGDLAERYKDRQGGFSRLIGLGPRRGDGAEMALVQLVGGPQDPFEAEKKPKGKARPTRRRSSTLDKVAAEVSAGEEADQPAHRSRARKPAAEAADQPAE